MLDPAVTGPYQQVVCADCGEQYTCTPSNDHYLRAGAPEGSPRVCFACLLAPVQEDHSGRSGGSDE